MAFALPVPGGAAAGITGMRTLLIALALALGVAAPALAQQSVTILQGGTGTTPVGPANPLSVTTTPSGTTPTAGTAFAIVTGGVAVTLITGPVNGCYVTNPLTATEQNIATAEVAQVNPVTTATATGRATNSTLVPGQVFVCPPGMTTNLSAIAATTAHAFNVVKW